MNALTFLLILAVPIALVVFWLGISRLVELGAKKPVVARLLMAIAGVLFLLVAVLEFMDNGRSTTFVINGFAAMALLLWALLKRTRGSGIP